MSASHSTQLGIWLRSEADRAILHAAALQAGLVPVEFVFPIDKRALCDPMADGVELMVADSTMAERLQAMTAVASPPGSTALLIVVEDETPEAGRTIPRQLAEGVWCLERPLRQEAVALQLSALAGARRVFAERQALLVEEVHRYRRIFDSISNGIAIGDATLPGVPLTYVNPAFERITGYPAQEVLGRNCNFLQGTDTNQPGVVRVREAIRDVRDVRGLLRNYRKDGTPFWNELYLSPIFDLAGALTHFVGIQNDVTEKVEAELQLAEELDRLHAAAECSLDSIYICEAVRDAEGEIVDFTFSFLNTNVAKMVFIPLKTLLGGRMCELLPVNRTLGLFDLYKRVVLTGEPLVHEFPVHDKDVRSEWIRVEAVKLKDGVFITSSDITLRKREEERTISVGQHDSLTALPNRSVLKDRIGQGMLWAKRYSQLLGVFLIDLDGFKTINDTLGHAAGDETLVTVAGCLSQCMRAVDSVIRVGGDEFIVIMPELTQRSDAEMLAIRILDELRLPMQIAGQSVSVTGSIGIAIYPGPAVTVEELLVQSDVAMYAAKRRGKNQYEIFQSAAQEHDILIP